MTWLTVTLVGYFLNAIAILISKWLLVKEIPEPVTFTFYIGVLNLIALVLIPFGVFVPTIDQFCVAILSGIAYAWAMYMLAKALSSDQASQVAPMVGGLQPIFVILFALWFLPEQILIKHYVGFGLLIIGSILMALELGRKNFYLFGRIKLFSTQHHHLFTSSLKYILTSSALFGLSYALLKLVYIEQGFISGFFWTRIGTFIFVMILLLIPGNWKIIKSSSNRSDGSVKGWFMIGQILGALSFLLVSYAISLGPVTIVNALQGVQYAFLFILIIILAKHYKYLLDEPLTKIVITQKLIAIILILAGLWFIV